MTISNNNQPKLPNLYVSIIKGKYCYLWPYTTKIVNGRLVRTKALKSVGSIQGGGQTGLVIWKQEFLDQNPELKAFDVYRVEASDGEQETTGEYKFVFVDKSSNKNQLNPRKEFVQAGATWFLDQMLANTPLLRALNNTFYNEQAASIILSLAYFVLLSSSTDFNSYVKCVGSIRLPYSNGLTERDINLFLKDISDVQIAKFFDELQSRYFERNSLTNQFYVIEHSYPNNLINNMIEGHSALSCSNNNLQQAIKKELQQTKWRSSNIKNKLSSMAKSLDDRAFTIINSNSGVPLFSSTYNSHSFSLEELISFCEHRIFVQLNKKDFNSKPNNLSQEYLEASTGGFNDIKASNAPDLMSYLGSYSEQGQVFARLQLDELDDSKSNLNYNLKEPLNTVEQSASSIFNEANSNEDKGATSIKAKPLEASSMLSPLRKKLSSKAQSSSSTSFSSSLAFSAPLRAKTQEPNKVEPKSSLESKNSVLASDKTKSYKTTFISYGQPKLLTQIRSLFKNNTSFILKLSSDLNIVKRWSDYFINELVTPENYSQDDMCFTFNTSLRLSFSDPCATVVIKGKSGKLISVPKKTNYPLSLSIKLDLQSLFNQAQELEDSMLDPDNEDSGFWSAQNCLTLSTLDKQHKLDENLTNKVLAIKEKLDNGFNKAVMVELHNLCADLLKIKHSALSVVISNTVSKYSDAFHAVNLLNASEQFGDYMSWDIFKLERVLFEPFMYLMRPEVSHLLRAKFFILFIASSLYNMIQCATYNKDQLYGTNKVRHELGFNNPHEYLKLLNSIVATRKTEGFVYSALNMQQQSLLEYLDTNAPAHESFNNVSSDGQVAMRNYTTKNHWLL